MDHHDNRLKLPLIALAILSADYATAKEYSLEPLLGVSSRWDSNYFYTPADESSIATWLIQPGGKFAYKAAKTEFQLKGTLDATMYSGDDEELDNFVGYTAEANLSSRPAEFRRLTLGLKDMLLRTRNPEFFGELRRSTSRELYKFNLFSPYVEYDLDRFRTSFEYENTAVVYDEDENNEDSMLHRGTLKALYKINRHLEFGPRFKLEAMSYEGSSNDYQGIDVGAYLTRNGKFVALQGSVGYHKREIDDAENSDLDDGSWQLAIQSQKNGFSNTSFKISLLGDINDAVSADGYYSTLQLKGSIERTVFKDVEFGINALYAQDDYELSGREDDISRIGLTAAYTVNTQLKLELELAQQQRDSTIDTNDYDSTSCMIKLNYIP